MRGEKKHKFVICCFVLAHSYTRLNKNPLAEYPPISGGLKHVMLPLSQRNISTSAHPALGSGPQHALRLSQWVLWYHSHPREGRLWNSSTHFSQCYLGFTRLSVREDLICVKTSSWLQNREDCNAVSGLKFCCLHLLAVDFCRISLCGLISVRLWLTVEGTYNNSVFFCLEPGTRRPSFCVDCVVLTLSLIMDTQVLLLSHHIKALVLFLCISSEMA